MSTIQSTLVTGDSDSTVTEVRPQSFEAELRAFHQFGTPTLVRKTDPAGGAGSAKGVETFVNEFWTSKQRAASSLHEVSYRACFKPQLPRFFIERLTKPGQAVYDPFMGRGTTLVETALLSRRPVGCDVNPLSRVLVEPRLGPPSVTQVADRLREIGTQDSPVPPEDLLTFYHPETLAQISGLRQYLLDRQTSGKLDDLDRWIRMVAVNRLTGHSSGFFSVYTLPPNQAVSVDAQRKINLARGQIPPRRDVKRLILEKTRSLLKDVTPLVREQVAQSAAGSVLLTESSAATPEIPDDSVALVVTSPPFLNVVDYAGDNWLRCWFCGIDPKSVALTVPRKLEKWESAMTETFVELRRVLEPDGHLAFEVGEVNRGRIKLEEAVIRCGLEAGLVPRFVVINDQEFTKTSNVWGVTNGRKGTNTNRIVLFRKS